MVRMAHCQACGGAAIDDVTGEELTPVQAEDLDVLSAKVATYSQDVAPVLRYFKQELPDLLLWFLALMVASERSHLRLEGG